MVGPFDTLAIEHHGQSLADMQAESIRLFERQRAIDAMLRGEVDFEYLLDMLAQHGIDPTAYNDCVESNLDFLWRG